MKSKIFTASAIAVLLLAGSCNKSNTTTEISDEDSARIADQAIENALAGMDSDDDEAPVSEEKPSPNPLTQYLFIDVTQEGVGIRSDLASVLKNRKFTVKEYPAPPVLDSPYDYDYVTIAEASREEPAGTTTVVYSICDVASRCDINFASRADAAAFIESMEKSKYRRVGDYFEHPKNKKNGLKLYVKVTEKKAVILSQFISAKPRF